MLQQNRRHREYAAKLFVNGCRVTGRSYSGLKAAVEAALNRGEGK